MDFVWQYWVVFTLPWLIVVVIVDAYLLVMFSSKKYNTPSGTPALWRPFAQFHQLRRYGPPVRRMVHAVSAGATGPKLDYFNRRILG